MRGSAQLMVKRREQGYHNLLSGSHVHALVPSPAPSQRFQHLPLKQTPSVAEGDFELPIFSSPLPGSNITGMLPHAQQAHKFFTVTTLCPMFKVSNTDFKMFLP